MNPAPAPPFEVVETAGGRLYRLPAREIGTGRWLALTPVFLAGLGLLICLNIYTPRLAQRPLTEWEWAGFALVALTYARGCYWLLGIAAALWCGQAEIELLHDGTLRSSDRAGWFRPRWGRVKPGTLRKLVLKELVLLKDASGKPKPAVLWQLLAETNRGGKVWLVLGYSREVLSALADRLAQDLTVATPEASAPTDNSATESPDPVRVVVEVQEIPSRDVLEQPPESRITLERHSDGVTLTIPPLGLGKANGGLIFMGGIFVLIGGFVAILALGPVFQPNPQWPSGAIFVGLMFLCLGGFFALSSLLNGVRRVVLAVVGDKLLTFESTPFGSRRREFTRDSLLDIACGPSNTSVNGKRLPQLNILQRDETQIDMLIGRDETELEWIATVLRQSLGLPSEPPEYREAKSGNPKPP